MGCSESDMSAAAVTLAEINKQRYDVVLRVSEGLSAGARPEELAKILAGQLGPVIPFEHLDVVVLKENCSEIEYHGWGQAEWPVPDLPIEKLLTWHVHNSQEPLQITDWNTDERVSEQLKDVAKTIGISVGSALLVPLTTPHRRLGTVRWVSPARSASRTPATISASCVASTSALMFLLCFLLAKNEPGKGGQVAVH
jgi:hypothetical protein